MTELLVIGVLALLVLGPKRLPEMARSLGRGLAEFRRASNDMRREFLEVADDARIRPSDLDVPDDKPAVAPAAESDQAGGEASDQAGGEASDEAAARDAALPPRDG